MIFSIIQIKKYHNNLIKLIPQIQELNYEIEQLSSKALAKARSWDWEGLPNQAYRLEAVHHLHANEAPLAASKQGEA